MSGIIEAWIDAHDVSIAGERRSSQWPDVRNAHIDAFPWCAVCDGTRKLAAHHVIPYHIDPSYELDPRNLVTLCTAGRYGINCHLLAGHRGNFQKMALGIEQNVMFLRTLIQRPVLTEPFMLAA